MRERPENLRRRHFSARGQFAPCLQQPQHLAVDIQVLDVRAGPSECAAKLQPAFIMVSVAEGGRGINGNFRQLQSHLKHETTVIPRGEVRRWKQSPVWNILYELTPE